MVPARLKRMFRNAKMSNAEIYLFAIYVKSVLEL